MQFEKLVRDSFGSEDSQFVTRKAKDDDEFLQLLKDKLAEEFYEMKDEEMLAKIVEECGDMLGTLYDIWKLKEIARKDVFDAVNALESDEPDREADDIISNLEDFIERLSLSDERDFIRSVSVVIVDDIRGLMDCYGLTSGHVIDAEHKKRKEKGGFDMRIVMLMESKGKGVLRDS